MSDSENEHNDCSDSEPVDVESGDETLRKRLEDDVKPTSKDVDVNKDTENKVPSYKDRNEFSPIHHRITESYLKRKYSEILQEEENETNGHVNKENMLKQSRLDTLFPSRQLSDQMFAMDASFKALSESGMPISGLLSTSTVTSGTLPSACADRLKPSVSRDNTPAGPSACSSDTTAKTYKGSPVKDDTSPKLPAHRPSFMITDILSPDTSTSARKGLPVAPHPREGCHSVFTDPRLYQLPHRAFVDRPLTASSCGSDSGTAGGGGPRFTDDSDLDDDNSDSDGT